MTSKRFPTSEERCLVIATPAGVDEVLVGQERRPIVALLPLGDAASDLEVAEPVVSRLIDAGCKYFVCFGEEAEVLHDRIDDLLVERAEECEVVTTWHDDETALDVAEFFFDVAGAAARTLLIAVLGSDDDELASALVQQLS